MSNHPPIPAMPSEPYKVEVREDGQKISYYHRKPGKKRTSKGKYFGVDVGGYSSSYDVELVNKHIAFNGFLMDMDFADGGPKETPHYRLENTSPKKGVRDFNMAGCVWLLSDHAKQVFEAIDAEAFRFIRCTSEYRDGVAGPTIWIARVERELDALDRENSDLELFENPDGRWGYWPAGNLNFLDTVISESHIFVQKTFVMEL
jgi:hypothetical protein